MYMKVSADKKMPKTYGMEKYLLRKAFETYNLLPTEVLWRMKEGMSDGVSSQSRGWYEIIQERAATIYTDEYFKILSATYTFNPPMFKEALWFRELFKKYYPTRDNQTPYYWLPKWSGDLVEPSARALAGVYKTNTPAATSVNTCTSTSTSTTTDTTKSIPNSITTETSLMGNSYFKIN